MKIFPLTLVPANTRIDFMRFRHVFITIAALAFFGALAVIGVKGFNFALDFTGGTAVNVRFAQPVSVDEVRERLQAAEIQNAQVQTFGSGNDLLIRVRAADDIAHVNDNDELSRHVLEAASTPDNPAQVLSTESIGSQVSGDLRQNAIYAAIFVLVGFLAYISVRFEKKFAVAAIILVGPGKYGLDAGRGWARRPFVSSFAALILGVGAGVAIWVLLNGANPLG